MNYARQSLSARKIIAALGEINDALVANKDPSDDAKKTCEQFLKNALDALDIPAILLVCCLSRGDVGAHILAEIAKHVPEILEPALAAGVMLGNSRIVERILMFDPPERNWAEGAYTVACVEDKYIGYSDMRETRAEINSTSWCCQVNPNGASCVVTRAAKDQMDSFVALVNNLGFLCK